MKIGIDAKWLYNGPISGQVVIASYVNCLKDHIGEDLEIYLILDKRDKETESKYSAYGFKFIYLWGRINLIANVILARKLSRFGLDAVLLQNFGPFGSGINYSLLIFDILFRDFPQFFSWKERLYFRMIKPSSKRSAHIFTISHSEKKRLIRYNYSTESNISVLPMGVDIQRFEKESALDFSTLKNRFNIPFDYVIYYGRLNDRKNIKNLSVACNKIFEKLGVGLVIAGKQDSLYSEYIENQDHVRLTGFIDDVELTALLKNSIGFCYISYAEGFGLPPLESMALGVPTVVSNTTSLPEVCGNASIFVDPYSIESIYDGIFQLITNTERRSKLIDEGYKNLKRFSWTESTAILLDQLKGTIK